MNTEREYGRTFPEGYGQEKQTPVSPFPFEKTQDDEDKFTKPRRSKHKPVEFKNCDECVILRKLIEVDSFEDDWSAKLEATNNALNDEADGRKVVSKIKILRDSNGVKMIEVCWKVQRKS